MSFNGTTLGFDISPLREGINEANTLIKTNESKWKEYASVMTDWNKNAEGLQARNDMLNEQLTEQEKKVSNQEKLVAGYIETFGEQSEVTQKQIQILNSYKTAVNKTNNEIARNETKINSLTEAEERAGKTTAELAKEVEAEINTRKQHQKAIAETEKKIDELSNAEGDHSDEIAQLRKQLAQERKALDDAGGAVEDLADETAEAEDKTEGFSGALRGLASGAKVAVAGLTAVAGAVTGAVGGMANIANETRESRGLFARLETNAEATGKAYEDLTEDLKGVYAVTGDLEAGMEGMNMLTNLKAGAEDITAVTKALTGASMKFDGLKFESIAEALQESVAGSAGAVGGFGELIERSGGDLEKFNAGMAKCKNETERTQYAMDWLAKSGLADVAESFKENNKSLVDARNAEIELQLATNELGAISEPVSNSIKTMGASFVNSLIPGLKGTVTAFKDMVNGVAGADKDLVYNIGYLIGSATRVVKGWWATAKPALGVLFGELFPQLAGVLIGKIPGWIANIARSLYENAPTLVSNLFNGIVEGLQGLQDQVSNPVLKKLLDWLIGAFQWVADNSGVVVDGLLLIAGAIAGFKIISTVKKLVDTFKTSFSALNLVMKANPIGLVITAVAGLVTGLTLLYKHSETFRNFVDGLWSKIKDFAGKIAGFAGDVKEKVKSIGTNIIQGVWEGISNAKDWIVDKIKSIFGVDGVILKSIRKLLGINSPAEELKPIGQYFMEGFEAGLEGRAGETVKTAKGVVSSIVDGVEGEAGEAGASVANSFMDKLKAGFGGAGKQVEGLISGAFDSAISGDKSAITNALQSTGNFLVSGLQNVISTAIPGVGGFIASAVGGIFSGIKTLIANKKKKEEQQQETKTQIDYAEALAQAQANAYNSTLRRAKMSIAEELGRDINANIKAISTPTATNVVNYTQNNYSPKALSAKEIYRNNNRAINMIQQGVRA